MSFAVVKTSLVELLTCGPSARPRKKRLKEPSAIHFAKIVGGQFAPLFAQLHHISLLLLEGRINYALKPQT
jgi:hypothetical protein